MTQKQKNNTLLNVALILISIVVGFVFINWLGSAFFVSMIGGKMDDATPLTGYQYWQAYGGHASIKQKLMIAYGIASVIPLLLLFLFWKTTKTTLHGEARFASKNEVKEAGLFANAGLIVGKFNGQYLQAAGSEHILLAAPTRSGKGVGVVIPNLLSWKDSVIVLDIKKENFNITAGFRQKHGQQVFMFSPLSPDHCTHRWNPLGYVDLSSVSATINDVQKIADFLFPDPPDADPMWTASSRSLFLGVVMLMIEGGGVPLTIGEVLRQVTAYEEAGRYFKRRIEEAHEAGKPLSGRCIQALNDFIATSTNTRTSIRKTFSSRLELWFNPLVDAATAENDFDLRDLRRKRMSIYVAVTPDDLARMQPILNLFFQQVLGLNTAVLPQDDPTLKHQCLLLLDEFTAIGKIPILSKGIGYIAGYGLRMLPIIQSPAQVREVYGHDNAESFFDNHSTHIIYTPKNNKIATEISETMGNQTWRVKSLSKSLGFSRNNKSESVSDQRRALMLPQELTTMPQTKAIILIAGLSPILCDKIRYYEDVTFTARLMPPPAIGKIVVNNEIFGDFVAAELPADSDEKTEPEDKAFTADDLEKLDSMSLEDFSCDFSGVVVDACSIDADEADFLTSVFMDTAAKAAKLKKAG